MQFITQIYFFLNVIADVNYRNNFMDIIYLFE